jgi:hypothetical protein
MTFLLCSPLPQTKVRDQVSYFKTPTPPPHTHGDSHTEKNVRRVSYFKNPSPPHTRTLTLKEMSRVNEEEKEDKKKTVLLHFSFSHHSRTTKRIGEGIGEKKR